MSQVVDAGFAKTKSLDNPLETVIDCAIGQAVSNLIPEDKIILPGFLISLGIKGDLFDPQAAGILLHGVEMRLLLLEIGNDAFAT